MANTVKKDFAAPDGPVLLLSANGLTTAGIAKADGVKDVSGRGNHGRAYGGVEVVKDAEMGDCFSSNAENTYIAINSNIYPLLSNVSQITFACRVKLSSFVSQQTKTLLIFVAEANGSTRLSLSILTNGKIEFGGRRIAGETMKVATSQQALSTNVCYSIIGVVDFSTKELKIYLNGEEISTDGVELNSSGVFSQPSMVQLMGFVYPNVTPYKFSGYLSDARIYPRALSAAEVKYLYNGFQSNIIVGQIIPSGAILDLSARGLTTAGIAQTDGVIDRSGNMNAGTAYGGISIVNDSSLGECFSFDGSDDYIEFNKSSFMDAFSNIQGLTVAFKMKPNNVSGKEIVLFEGFYDEAITLFAIRLYQGKINYYVRRKTSDSWVTYSSSLSITQNGVYRVAALFDWQHEKVSLYIDGTLDSTYDTSFGAGNLLNSPTFIWLGKHSKVNRCYRGLLTDVLVYPRVLTASEVQQLADASLKKITNIKLGSSDIKRIYLGNSLIYAKVSDYSVNIPIENKTINLDASATDLWGVCKIRSTGDYVLACGNANIIKVYDGTTGNFKFSTSMVNTSALKYDVCPGKEADVIYLSEHTTNDSNSKIRKLRYTGTGFTEITDTAVGSWHGITYDHANNRIIGTNYYGSAIQAFSDDDDTTEMTQVLNISAPYRVANVKVTSDGRYIYYTGYNNNYLGRYDTVTGTRNNNFMRMLSSGSGWTITGFALSDDEKKIVFVNNPNKCIKVLDLETGQITATIDDSDSYTLRISNIGNNVFLYVAWDKDQVIPKYIIEKDLSDYLV